MSGKCASCNPPTAATGSDLKDFYPRPFFIQNPQINELFPLHLELRRLDSIQPLIVFNNSNYSIEKEHAIHHQSCHFGVRQWPLQARQLNHLVTLWMGSFVTVSCYDYYFVTLDPSDLIVSQGVKSSAHDNHKPWMCSHKSSSRQGDVRSGVFSNKVFWSTEGIFDSVHSQMWDFLFSRNWNHWKDFIITISYKELIYR